MFSDLRYLQQLGVQVECGCYDCDVTSTQISDDSELNLSLDPSLSRLGGAACVVFCLFEGGKLGTGVGLFSP